MGLLTPPVGGWAAPGDPPIDGPGSGSGSGLSSGSNLSGKGKFVNLGPDSLPLPSVWAATWLVANADTGEIYAAKGPNVLRPPASTLKTLTALTLMPRLDSQARVTVKKKAVNTYGSEVGLLRGKTYSVSDLYYALLLPSANDAAIALGQANGGVKKTVNQMNSTAQSLGALNTLAKNTHGLDAPGQVSTAYDLALIARAAMQIDNFNTIVRTKKYNFPYKKRTREIYNTNRLITGDYKGARGVKTGFTSEAGRTFIGAAKRKGVTLIVVGMGIKEASATAAEKLLDWAFINMDTVTPVGILAAPPQVDGSPPNDSSGESTDTESVTTIEGQVQVPGQTTSAGPTSPDPLAIGWLVLFVAIAASVLAGARSAIIRRRTRGRLPNAGRIKLEG